MVPRLWARGGRLSLPTGLPTRPLPQPQVSAPGPQRPCRGVNTPAPPRQLGNKLSRKSGQDIVEHPGQGPSHLAKGDRLRQSCHPHTCVGTHPQRAAPHTAVMTPRAGAGLRQHDQCRVARPGSRAPCGADGWGRAIRAPSRTTQLTGGQAGNGSRCLLMVTLPCRLHPQAPQGDRDQRERPAWDSHLLLGGEAQHAPRGADSSTESTRPDLKTGGRPEQTSFQRRHTGGQRAQGKGLNGADGQGDASQATMGVTSGDRRDDRREWGPGQSPSCAAGMYSPTGAMGSGVGRLKTASTELPYDPAIPPLGLHLRKSKTLSRKGICTPALTAALQSQDAEGTQVSRRVDGYGRCCPSPQRDVSQPRGTGTAHHGDSSEGPGGRCSVRETRRGTNAAGGHRDEAPTADSEARRGRGPGESLGQVHGPPTHAD